MVICITPGYSTINRHRHGQPRKELDFNTQKPYITLRVNPQCSLANTPRSFEIHQRPLEQLRLSQKIHWTLQPFWAPVGEFPTIEAFDPKDPLPEVVDPKDDNAVEDGCTASKRRLILMILILALTLFFSA